jgi:3-dehydroquinate synthase
MKKIKIEIKQSPHQYDIKIGSDQLKNSAVWAQNCLERKTKKIAMVSNKKVFELYGEVVKASFENEGIEVCVFLMPDGERYKNFRTFEKALNFFAENKLSRTDAVVALGGGVVGDLAGFAAASYLRGVAFLQIPTTLVAMIDSSVGGKTAVNTEFGKNLIGAFYQPNGVLIDVETLQTLARRELSAGFCEAIKQGAIADKKLFAQTAEFLESFSLYKFKNYFLREEFISKLQDLILAQVDFKARIVMQDEKESPERVDNKSRKILNFGHTLAHALEKVTDYKYFKHGEAVGYGILFAAQLSKELGIFDENELKLLNETVYRVGVLPKLGGIDPKRVLEAFPFDKKVVNDSLQWILLEKIGAPVVRRNKDITSLTLTKSLIEFLGK